MRGRCAEVARSEIAPSALVSWIRSLRIAKKRRNRATRKYSFLPQLVSKAVGQKKLQEFLPMAQARPSVSDHASRAT